MYIPRLFTFVQKTLWTINQEQDICWKSCLCSMTILKKKTQNITYHSSIVHDLYETLKLSATNDHKVLYLQLSSVMQGNQIPPIPITPLQCLKPNKMT